MQCNCDNDNFPRVYHTDQNDTQQCYLAVTVIHIQFEFKRKFKVENYNLAGTGTVFSPASGIHLI